MRILVIKIDGWRRNLMIYRQYGKNRLNAPSGPKQKGEYGKFGGSPELWTTAKTHSRLKVYTDLGTVVPRANPLPYPQ